MAGERETGVGLPGAGRMGSLHIAAYRGVRMGYPEFAARPRLAVVADPVAERAREAERYGLERWTTDSAEVIAEEAVSLTTPNNIDPPLQHVES
jgi:predicted dehydrogenase